LSETGRRGTENRWRRPLWGIIHAQWIDWKRGIPPGRRWDGRGEQNPYLLAAFAVLDRVEAKRASGGH
jgi:hypothetical protein